MIVKVNGKVINENVVAPVSVVETSSMKSIDTSIVMLSTVLLTMIAPFKHVTDHDVLAVNKFLTSASENIHWVEVYNKDKGGWIDPYSLPEYARNHLYPELADKGFDPSYIVRLICLIIVVVLSICLYEMVKKSRQH